MKTVDYEDGVLTVKFSGDDFYTCLDFVKNLPGAVFVKESRTWKIPPLSETVKKLKSDNWIFSDYARKMFFEDKKKEIYIDEKQLEGLFPFQVEGVKWLENTGGVGIIGDEMGIGKTIQSIGYAKIHEEKRPVLVICPASVKLNWSREIEKWTGECTTILKGRTSYSLALAKWYILNYDIVADWLIELIKIDFKIIIVDESQMIANGSAIRTKAVKELRNKFKKSSFIGLSGTPIRNRSSEFFTILNLVAPNVFSNRWKYLHRYCAPYYNGFGWVFNGSSNIEELHEITKPYMIRRLKSEVLKDLPQKIKSIVPLELETIEKSNYEDAEGDFKDWLDSHKELFLAQQQEIEKLKQLAYLAKRNAMMSWISDFLSSGEKLVVMAYHTMAINDIFSKFKDSAVRIDGSTPQEERQKAIDSFQNDPKINLFVGQILAAGVGITLTSASNLAFVEFTFTPADHAQAEDRIHRIGQTAESVNIYYLVADGTVENKLVEMIIGKHKIVKRILDGQLEEFISKDQTGLLVKELSKQYMKTRI